MHCLITFTFFGLFEDTRVEYQPPFVDYQDSNANDYSNIDTKSETLPPLPEKLEKAIETVQEYLNHPDSVEDLPGGVGLTKQHLSSTPKVSLPTSTTSLSTTVAASTVTTTTLISSSTTSMSAPELSLTTANSRSTQTNNQKKSNHRKKPLSSFDNDTEVDVTLGTVFNSYGVDRENIGFIFDSSYCFLVCPF